MTLRDDALEAIKAMILSGELYGKTSEREILEKLSAHRADGWPGDSLSRTPVREALAVLSHVGLIAQIPQRGVAVLRMTVDAADQSLRLRTLIEGQVVGHFLDQDPDGWEQFLVDARQANSVLDDAATIEDLMQAETRFHSALPESLRLDEHAQSISAYSDKLHLFRTQLADGRVAIESDEARAFGDEHRAILDALASGDRSAARSALDCHCQQIRERLEQRARVAA